ncbi:MAG: helix-turn-helix domain-containing protein [Olsenella sp.]|nr:helix-turn-helix domain-containing protein [Olsenella sp.]
MNKDVMTVSDAVREGYGSCSTLMRRIRDGKLPSVKKGGRRYVKRSDLESAGLHQDVRTGYENTVHLVVSQAPSLSDAQVEAIAGILSAGRDSR